MGIHGIAKICNANVFLALLSAGRSLLRTLPVQLMDCPELWEFRAVLDLHARSNNHYCSRSSGLQDWRWLGAHLVNVSVRASSIKRRTQ
jgi:hypothetical protein